MKEEVVALYCPCTTTVISPFLHCQVLGDSSQIRQQPVRLQEKFFYWSATS